MIPMDRKYHNTLDYNSLEIYWQNVRVTSLHAGSWYKR